MVEPGGKLARILGAVSLAIALAGAWTSPATAQRSLSVLVAYPEREPLAGALAKLAERLAQASADALVIEQPVRFETGLGPSVLPIVQSGAVDIAIVPAAALADWDLPAFAALELPYLANDWEETRQLTDSLAGRMLLGSLDDVGLLGLDYWPLGLVRLALAAEEETLFAPDAPQALRVRTFASAGGQEVLRHMGIDIGPFGSLTTQLATGEVSGFETLPASLVADSSLLSWTKSLTAPVRPTLATVVIHASTWDTLTLAEQQMLGGTIENVGRELRDELIERESAALGQLVEHGLTIGRSAPESLVAMARDAWHEPFPGEQGQMFIDSLETAVRPAVAPLPPAPQRDGRASDRQIYFATNREDFGGAIGSRFGAGPGGALRLGVVRATVRPGAMPGLITGYTVAHGAASDMSPTDLRSALAGRDILLFVHGFNNSFIDAADTAALLAYGTRHTGNTLLFSWPADTRFRYGRDRDAATSSATATAFADLIEALGDDRRRLDIVAHSMGGEVVAGLVRSGLPGAVDELIARRLVFIATDVDAGAFIGLTPRMALVAAERRSLYASDCDDALKAAVLANHGLSATMRERWAGGTPPPRAGQAGRLLLDLGDVDVIDASAADNSFTDDPANHSYLTKSAVVLADLAQLLVEHREPPRFHLDTVPPAGERRYVHYVLRGSGSTWCIPS